MCFKILRNIMCDEECYELVWAVRFQNTQQI